MLSADDSSFLILRVASESLVILATTSNPGPTRESFLSSVVRETLLSLRADSYKCTNWRVPSSTLQLVLLVSVTVEDKTLINIIVVIAAFQFNNSLRGGFSPLDPMSRTRATFYLGHYRSFKHDPAVIIAQYPV
jgi:hypothetical protein